MMLTSYNYNVTRFSAEVYHVNIKTKQKYKVWRWICSYLGIKSMTRKLRYWLVFSIKITEMNLKALPDKKLEKQQIKFKFFHNFHQLA